MTAAGPMFLAVEDSAVTPGLLGFIVVALLGAATWLLVRSMMRQMRKVDFVEHDRDEPKPTAEQENGPDNES
jgi:hypothetical protein